METAKFLMVEELASLIKENLSCKHLVLSIEESLINFLQNDSSPDRVLELEPMNPYHRLLLHRLADIYGFAHESVGEGNDRHLILEKCPESSIPSVLVSDILCQYDEFHSSMTPHHMLKKEDSLPDMKMKETSFLHSMSFKEREAAYLAARERIFSLDEDDVKLPVPPKQRSVPVVARRMIAHALGRRICSDSPGDEQASISNNESNVILDIPDGKDQSCSFQDSNADGRKMHSKQKSKSPVSNRLNGERGIPSVANCHSSSDVNILQVEYDGKVGSKNILEQENFGAAKKMFAHALGLSSAKQNQGITLRHCGDKQITKG